LALSLSTLTLRVGSRHLNRALKISLLVACSRIGRRTRVLISLPPFSFHP
jgi:hypothetical protein